MEEREIEPAVQGMELPDVFMPGWDKPELAVQETEPEQTEKTDNDWMIYG